ncbi:MAG: GAF domain-containing protein [Anaerolineae bacterium]|nr:GAF domain-containing protein [Anaerolineae bacterium]
MTDETQKLDEMGSEGMPATSQEAARKLVIKADELVTILQTHRETLRLRGMTLPTGVLETVNHAKARLEALNKQILTTLIELRTLRALADTTALLTSNLNLDEVLNQVMDTVLNLTGAERGYIVLKNRETGEYDQFAVARGIETNLDINTGTMEAKSGQARDFIISRSIISDVVANGKPVLTTNAQDDPRYSEQKSIVGYALRSIIAVPLTVRDEMVGIVYCDNRILAGLFQQRELDLLSAFADHAAVAIDNARLFTGVRDRLREITTLNDLLERIFDSIPTGVITLNNHDIVTTSNHAAGVIFGRDSGLVGNAISAILGGLPETLYNAMRYVTNSNIPMLVDIEIDLPERGRRYWNISISVLKAVQDQSDGLALVINDLTEQRAREQQLAEAARYLPTALLKNLRTVAAQDVAGQEREITAMFCDVRGFTSFSEQLDPAQLMSVINQYLSLSSDAINLYEGIVDKYMGDAVTGLFNTQLNPQPNHAERAVSAGLAMLSDLEALHETLPEEQRLFYGIGIHTGIAVLGNVGGSSRKEFGALGEATEISKILQENARGAVVISEATYEQVKETFECEPMTIEKTKGREDLTRAYRVIRRMRGTTTNMMFLDDELKGLLGGLDD